MEIKATYSSRLSGVLEVIYRDLDDEREIGDRIVSGVHAYCFCDGRLVIVNNGAHGWQPPGGHTEAGETVQETVACEVKEETNMRVIKQRLIGYQDIFEPQGITSQTRSVCIVEPYGDFISDPDGDITEIKLIDPGDYKQYFDWGKIGDRVMARATELIDRLKVL